MTDGERLVWASSYAIAFVRDGDAVTAARSATRAVVDLRDAATRRIEGILAISQVDERDFVDEMVTAP